VPPVLARASTLLALLLVTGCGSGDSKADSGASIGRASTPSGASGVGGGGGTTTPSVDWPLPDCASSNISIGFHDLDAGTTLRDVPEGSGFAGCHQIVLLAEPGVLLAVCDFDLYRSTDAGCQFEVLDDTCSYEQVVAAPDGGAYAFCRVRGPGLEPLFVAIDGDTVAYRDAEPPPRALQLAVNPEDADHVRLFTSDREIHESSDRGETWAEAGAIPSNGGYAPTRSVGLDPTDFDHFVLSDWDFVWFTDDGGDSFVRAMFEFDGRQYDESSMGEVLLFPSEPARVYAYGELKDGASTVAGSDGLYESTDGGRSFVRSDSPGPSSYAHPTRSGEVYAIELQTTGSGSYPRFTGTHLFQTVDGVRTQFELDGSLLATLAFSPADPDFLYLGSKPAPW
jgi:hypothetical protein